MSPLSIFLLATTLGLLAYLAYTFKSPSATVTYFKTPIGKGAFAGIITFMVVGLSVAGAQKAFSTELTYLNYAEISMGLEATKNISPMCYDNGGPDKRTTSNGSIRLNVLEWKDYRTSFSTNLQYLHHSCALNQDNQAYDSFGFQMTYRINFK